MPNTPSTVVWNKATGNLEFLDGGVFTKDLIGAYVKHISNRGVITLQLADGSEQVFELEGVAITGPGGVAITSISGDPIIFDPDTGSLIITEPEVDDYEVLGPQDVRITSITGSGVQIDAQTGAVTIDAPVAPQAAIYQRIAGLLDPIAVAVGDITADPNVSFYTTSQVDTIAVAPEDVSALVFPLRPFFGVPESEDPPTEVFIGENRGVNIFPAFEEQAGLVSVGGVDYRFWLGRSVWDEDSAGCILDLVTQPSFSPPTVQALERQIAALNARVAALEPPPPPLWYLATSASRVFTPARILAGASSTNRTQQVPIYPHGVENAYVGVWVPDSAPDLQNIQISGFGQIGAYEKLDDTVTVNGVAYKGWVSYRLLRPTLIGTDITIIFQD